MIIYAITNQIDGKKYIVQTRRTLPERWREHLHSARQPSRHKMSPYLYAAMNKYGFENFSAEVVEQAETQEELDERETFWITELDTTNRDKGYNISFGGASPVCNPETSAKLSASLKGKPAWNKGRPMEEEHLRNTRVAAEKRRGKPNPLTEEGRRRLSEDRRGEKNPNYGGKANTPEAIEKRAAQLRGRPAWNKGIPQTLEAREKMRGPRPSLSGPRPHRRAENSSNYREDVSLNVIKQLFSMGFSAEKIAKRVSCCTSTIYNRLGDWPESEFEAA